MRDCTGFVLREGYRLASTAQASDVNLFSYLLILVATTGLLLLRMSHLVKDAIVLAYEPFELTLPLGIQAHSTYKSYLISGIILR